VHRLAGKRLLIAADGALHLAPFAALPVPAASRPESGSGVPLIVEHEIVYLPSPSTLALVRGEWDRSRHWPRSVVVLADPVFEADDPRIGRGSPTAPGRSTSPVEPMARALRDVGGLAEGAGIPRLLDSRREARAIASLLPDAQVALDFDASRSTATSPELSRYRIVHIATHGIVDNDHPDLSGIILSLFDEKGRPQDGFLRLHDIYNLNLPADLVVLSACSTALGRAVSGEGLIGLVRGFMYAGSRRVLASLWNVDDEATGELMRRFYTRMFRNNEAPSAALRAAQLEMLGQKRWSEARYWAAWVLQGEWQADGRPVPGVRQ
jgi:CHAT domain-containing protein